MKKLIPTLICDAVLLAGLVILAYGLALAWRPLGFISFGLSLSVVAFLFGNRRAN